MDMSENVMDQGLEELDELDDLADAMETTLLEYESIIACVDVFYNGDEHRGDSIDYHFDEDDNVHIEETVTNDLFSRVSKATSSTKISLHYNLVETLIFDYCLYKKILVKITFS